MITRRDFLKLPALAIPLAGGCVPDNKPSGIKLITNKGITLWWNDIGAMSWGYAPDNALDVALEDSVNWLWRYGVPREHVEAVARGCPVSGYDCARFPIAASPTGYASGVYYSSLNAIGLAFWSRAKGDVVPPDAPPWTVYTWGSLRPYPKYDWGYVPPFFPAYRHELGHAIFGPEFEHTWVPPIVNPSVNSLLDYMNPKHFDLNYCHMEA